MKKVIIIVVLMIALITPFTVNAQNNLTSFDRTVLLQLIASLQKQVVILSERLSQTLVTVDRCPNIRGVQGTIPEGLHYSRDHAKCITEREADVLDEEEAKEEACEISKDELDELREEYEEIDDKIKSIKKEIPTKSIGTTVHLKSDDIPLFLLWIEKYYTPTSSLTKKKIEYAVNLPTNYYFGGTPSVGKVMFDNGCSEKAGCSYDEELIQMALRIILLEDQLRGVSTKIQRAEINADKNCD